MTSTLLIGMGPGLGRALVRAFARDGNKVAFVGRRAEEIKRHESELRAEGLDVSGHVGDAGDAEAMERIHADVARTIGPPDVLLYNAAMIEPSRFVTRSGLEEVKYGTADGWASHGEPVSCDYLMKTLRTNVAGALHAAQSVVPAMMERGTGTILLTGGVLAFGPWLEWGATSLGKAALRSLGLSLDKELRPAGIHVCTIAIHGTMQAGTPYDHDLVAQAYLRLHHEAPAQWQPEFHFRPDDAGADPDDPEAR
ncbi:SDR family NAD(P)-dependent oxidoreductase [Microvirga sp. M2]|uniref:SDR family NAD(P)-dependent oxidoreductase n=1 Tax=Microvirga sp. M2 TaxID=3073270 RepID=UPI0039C1BD2A